jgi:2-haloacid dehalogenase
MDKAQGLNKLALVFDFGGVLMDWNPRYLYQKFFPGDPQAVERFLAEIGFFEWNGRQDAGLPFSQAVAELCALHPEHEALIQAYDTRWEETIGGAIQPTVAVLQALHEAGYPLYGLSNWSVEKFALVRPQYEFFGWFDRIVISGEAGVAKPDVRIFQLLLDQIGRPAEECVFIDDSKVNIDVAGQLGFKTILFRSAGQMSGELEQLGIRIGTMPT